MKYYYIIGYQYIQVIIIYNQGQFICHFIFFSYIKAIVTLHIRWLTTQNIITFLVIYYYRLNNPAVWVG